LTAAGQEPGGIPRPARIAVMPAFNEAATIEDVLDDLYPRVDRLVIVNDGSVDDTGRIVDAWAAGRERVTVIHFPANRGLSAALRAGWDEVRAMLARGEVSADDVAFSIDADGQHEPSALDGMIEHLVRNSYDCVIGKRNMSYHTPYKVVGNGVMTLIGRVSGWTKFHDIESGYRVFRIGPLLEAQEYYRGYKYSETVEVAVILARLGYRVDNSYGIEIPVARTRTRLYDAAVDAVCMPLSWYRLACWRDLPKGARGRYALIVPAVVAGLAAVVLVMMLTHAFYLGDDSAHSYAHVWYLSESLFEHGEWPMHVSQLENGDAVMFPYGFIPWVPDAILRPVLGDWVVTLSMVAGVVFLLVAMCRFRPALRNPLLFALVLLNPLLWNGVTQFQLATVWAFAFFFLAGAAFERGRMVAAGGLLVASFASHPMMGLAACGLYGVWELVRARTVPWRFVAVTCAAGAVASPAFYLMFETPLIREAGTWRLLTSGVDNLRRLTLVGAPLAIAQFAPWVLARHRWFAGAAAGATAAILVVLPPSGLWEQSQPRFEAYLAEHPIDPAGHYRVMLKNNHEDGMVEFLKKGAVLANEFFTESERRQKFPSIESYTCFLATKEIDHVVIHHEYLARYRRSELGMLDQMVAANQAQLEFEGADGTRAYLVHPPAAAKKASISDCHL